MFVLVTDYTLRKVMSTNDQDILAGTGRAHCQRQVAFFCIQIKITMKIMKINYLSSHTGYPQPQPGYPGKTTKRFIIMCRAFR